VRPDLRARVVWRAFVVNQSGQRKRRFQLEVQCKIIRQVHVRAGAAQRGPQIRLATFLVQLSVMANGRHVQLHKNLDESPFSILVQVL